MVNYVRFPSIILIFIASNISKEQKGFYAQLLYVRGRIRCHTWTFDRAPIVSLLTYSPMTNRGGMLCK